MADEKTPLEQALDLFVYAPLGLALTAREELPRLAEKGRQRVNGQLMMARMMGQFAVAQGQKEAEKAVKRFTAPPAPPTSRTPAASAPAAPPSTTAPAPSASPSGPSAAAATSTSTPSTAASNGSSNGSANGGAPPVDGLAIPGYDSLSASQVVQRLAGLSGDELVQVAKYESATRHRKTILTRIAQLQSS